MNPISLLSNFQRPLLICGFHHSGTRLLAKLLHEMGVFQVGSAKTFEWKYIQDMNSTLMPLWYDPQAVRDFKEDKAQGKVPKFSLARGLFKQGYRFNQSWGHKDPRTCVTLGVWLKRFPKARVVHLLRDPLDVLCTLPEAYSKFTPKNCLPQSDLVHWGQLWMACTDKVCQYGPKAVSYYEMKFEDLVTNPELALQTLSDHLALENVQFPNLQGIRSDKIGVHQRWIDDGRLDPTNVSCLEQLVSSYRSKFGWRTLNKVA